MPPKSVDNLTTSLKTKLLSQIAKTKKEKMLYFCNSAYIFKSFNSRCSLKTKTEAFKRDLTRFLFF